MSWVRRRALIGAGALALVLLATLPYLGARSYPLIHDDRTLLDNAWMAREADARAIVGHDYWYGTRHAGSDLYRPLTILALAWNLQLAPAASSFRTVNMLLHAAVVLAVWIAWARVFGRLGERRPVACAGLGAALFAVHPLASESVMFAVGRAEMLAAALGLGGFAVLLGGERGAAPGAARTTISAALLFLALCAKESAAAWIVILLGWWLVERGPWLRRIGPAWMASLLLFLVLRGSVVGWTPHERPWIDNPLVLEGAAGRIANALCILARYGIKMVWPDPLTVHYEYDQVAVWPLWPWALLTSAGLLLGWVAMALWLRRAARAALFLWIFVPAAFAVTANLVLPTGTLMAERLAYLPLAGASGLGGLALARIPRRWLVAPLLTALVVAGGWRTVERTRDYRNKATFVEAQARASPRAVKALYNVGYTRLRFGHAAEALGPLERAVEIWPGYALALAALAHAHAELGDVRQAAEYRRRAEDAARMEPSARPRPR